jgi:sodium transport system permease protein
MNALQVVLLKELRDGFRDRRSLLSATLYPLLTPMLIGLLMFSLTRDHGVYRPLELHVAGVEHAPHLVEMIEAQGVDVVPATVADEALVKRGDLDALLVIPADYGEAFRAGRTAEVELVMDGARVAAMGSVRRARVAVDSYEHMLRSQRLLARGVDPQLMDVVDVVVRDLASPDALAANLLEMIGLFLSIACFVCSMYIAIDTTAGERERRSLEPLLINPIPRWTIVMGKWGAAMTFAALGLTVTLISTALALMPVPLETIGMRISLTPVVLLQLMLVCLPLAAFAAAVQLLVATFATSFKEAQTTLSLTLMAPMLPGLLQTLSPVRQAEWMFALPMLSQQLLLTEVIRTGNTPLAHAGLAAATTLLAAALALGTMTALLNRERTLDVGS